MEQFIETPWRECKTEDNLTVPNEKIDFRLNSLFKQSVWLISFSHFFTVNRFKPSIFIRCLSLYWGARSIWLCSYNVSAHKKTISGNVTIWILTNGCQPCDVLTDALTVLVERLKFRLLVKFTYVLIGQWDKFFGVLTSVVRCVADSFFSTKQIGRILILITKFFSLVLHLNGNPCSLNYVHRLL